MRATEFIKKQQGVAENSLDEGVNDPHIFKAIAMIGPMGAGKSTIARQLVGGSGLRSLNLDNFNELLIKQGKVVGGNLTPDQLERNWQLTQKQKGNWVSERLGLLIDGSGRNIEGLVKPLNELEQLGYDTMIILVNVSLETSIQRQQSRAAQQAAQFGQGRNVPLDLAKSSYQQIQQNIPKLKQLYGNRLLVINNEGAVDLSQEKTIVDRFMAAPPSKPAAVAWIKAHSQSQGQKIDKQLAQQQRRQVSAQRAQTQQGVSEGISNAVIFFRGEPILSQERLNQLKSSIGKPYPILRKEGSAKNIGTYMTNEKIAKGYITVALAGQGKGGAVTKIAVDIKSFQSGDGGIDEAVIITNIAGLVSDQTPNKNDPLRIQDRKKAMLKYLGPGVKKYLNDPLLSDPKIVQSWYNPEFAQQIWNTIKSGKRAETKPGESNILERMKRILGPLAEKIRRDPEVISYFIAHKPNDWVEYNFRMNSDGSGTKVLDVKYYPPAKQGVAEGHLKEDVGGNYLYYSVESSDDAKLILSSGYIKASGGAQTATQQQTKLPVVSVSRSINYAVSGANVERDYQVVFVLDRNAIESRYKTFGTSQHEPTKSDDDFWNANSLNYKIFQKFSKIDTNRDGKMSDQELDAYYAIPGNTTAFDKRPNTVMAQMQNQKYATLLTKYYRSKSGKEFEEVIPVKSRQLPLKGILVGFYLVPNKAAAKDQELLNHPMRLTMPRPNTFVKVTQQGVAEGRSKDFAERHYAAREIEKILDNLLSSESPNVTPEIFKKIKELVAITGRSQDIRYFGSAGELLDQLVDMYRQSQIRSGQMPQFTGRASAARDMARQIANQTRGTYRYIKPQTWTTRFGQRYRDPADYVVYPDQQSYDDALEWIENKGKKVRYRDNFGGLTDATQIGSYIIEPSTFTQDAFSDKPQTTHSISVRLAKTINQGGREQIDITDQQAAALQDIASTKSQNAIQSIQLILKVLQGEQNIKQIIDNSKKITPQDKAKLDTIIAGAKNFQEPNQGVAEDTDHGNNQPLRLRANTGRVQKFIEAVYARYPQTFQNNHVMSWGEGEAQQLALFELVPSMSKRDAVDVKWFQAYPLRQGVGSRAMRVLQDMAREDGISLTLYPWDKGQISQAKLIKFYKSHGFKPTIKGSKNMVWEPVNKQGVAEGFDGDEEYYGIIMNMIEGEDGFKLTARSPDGEKLGFVEFSYDTDGTIRAEELEVYEKHRGRGIAKIMYDYVKDQGFKIARSDEQTPAGAGFWDKHRPGKRIWEQGVAEGSDAEAYKEKLLTTLPQIMRFFEKNGKGWKPSKEQMLAAVETGYTVMKHTGDVKQAGKAMMDELNTLHRMGQDNQDVAEGLNEFATGSGGGGKDDILKTLAAQWLNGDVSSGDLDSDIQSQEKVERRLARGIICPDGVKRKLYIDYSDDYKGVVIYSDDNWSITYKQDDLTESKQGVAEAWSEKYKKSINCKNPKGFSQRAHCQGRKKK